MPEETADDDLFDDELLLVVLASRSPRRRELLEFLFDFFHVMAADIDESPLVGEEPEGYARRLAHDKAQAVRASLGPNASERLVIGADTVVALNDEILGKPTDAAEARVMLRRLSDQTHQVFTGFALFAGDAEPIVDAACTTVVFDSIPDHAIDEYIETGLPFDRAGAYGIQDAFGACYVREIQGDYNNVVGLPVNAIGRALSDAGIV